MELNKNSKWIKFYLEFNTSRPTNHCDYFWGSLKSILISLFTLTILLSLVTCLLSPIILIWSNYEFESTLGTFQTLGISFWSFGLLMYIIYKILEYYDNKPYKHKKDSLIKTWYKDFKNKHCTMITWKD